MNHFTPGQRSEIARLIKKAKAEGAKKMLDYVILAGVEIDGVDYLILDDVLERSKYLLKDKTL